MSLTPGTHLGPYEILAAIGAGGMGEVYRARDTRLNRDVAIKILPEVFAADADRVARFRREAQVLASLNHPHIASIYGLEQSGDVNALVLELVEGPTLADRLAHGPIPLDEALPIARQVAEALEAAHDHGIVHRDLKPANIKLRADGTVKVLDFGLAKVADPASSIESSLSPTLTSPAMTRMGVILGTAAYMSPEQARGKPVDRRTDVWAFGCVLYEMLTGRRAFGGDDLTVTLAAIIRAEPEWQALPETTPAPIRRLLRRALVKDATDRLADVSVARLEIKDALSSSEEPASPKSRRFPWRMTAAAAIVALALAGTTVALLPRTGPSQEALWFALSPPNDLYATPSVAVSPDGRRVAFLARNQSGERTLWIRPFTSAEPQEIAGTSGAVQPFWSPDGKSIAFFANKKLKRVGLDGGSPQELAEAPSTRGGTWGTGGIIVFAPTAGASLYRVPADGGQVTKITTLDSSKGEQEHLYPHFLPDGRHFLYTARFTDERATALEVTSVDSTDVRVLGKMRSRAEYANGYLFFGNDDNLFAQPFDVNNLETLGGPRRVADRVGVSFGNMLNYAFSVRDNILVTSVGGDSPVTQLRILDRAGKTLAELGDRVEAVGIAVSPDQRYVTTESRDPKTNTTDIWMSDLSTGVRARFTSGTRAARGMPVWSPDSRKILFTDWAENYFVKPIQGGELEQWPHKMKQRGGWPVDWIADGRYLVVEQYDPTTLSDIWLLSMSGDRKPSLYLGTPFVEWMPSVSPDSRWMAYVSYESGSSEVYINSFPTAGTPVRISLKGGARPVWGASSQQLYYVDLGKQLVESSLQIRGLDVNVASRQVLFSMPLIDNDDDRHQYAPLSHGERFVVNAEVEQPHRRITVVMNWPALLKQ